MKTITLTDEQYTQLLEYLDEMTYSEDSARASALLFIIQEQGGAQ